MYIYGLVYIIDAYELSYVSISSIVQRDSNAIMRKIESYRICKYALSVFKTISVQDIKQVYFFQE